MILYYHLQFDSSSYTLKPVAFLVSIIFILVFLQSCVLLVGAELSAAANTVLLSIQSLASLVFSTYYLLLCVLISLFARVYLVPLCT
jgi:hypothetical protein